MGCKPLEKGLIMSETNLFKGSASSIEDRVKVREWNSEHRSVYGEIDLKVRFDLERVMDVIEQDWLKFDKPVRRKFARRIAALDQIDAIDELKEGKKEDDEDEGFKW